MHGAEPARLKDGWAAMARLFHVSDLHFGAEDGEALAWFADSVRAERPDAVICTGDLTMRGRRSEYASALEYLLALDVPMTIEPGNHDLPVHNIVERLARPYARYRELEAAIEHTLEIAGVALIPLRTTARAQWRLNWSYGWVRDRHVAQATTELAAVPDEHVKIVTCHHPLLDPEGFHSAGKTRGGLEALSALANAGADAVLSGHVHDPFDRRWTVGNRSVRLIGAGTLSERVRATRPSFNELVVEDGALDLKLRMMA